jgi:hypothetical protein
MEDKNKPAYTQVLVEGEFLSFFFDLIKNRRVL